ncbi:MAG: CBS domain-containing protein [Cytophagaceae bacterium]|nr:CBS domain-containing protein [Cytophagaceae bacterium]MBK9933561.1 CBS domain-containing protein [Cytophagaceae bacterium]MBL0302725.1 CBS domain-containing protein [Cytophagaceae bacterium]MBL0325548.1 CBS domain-containing protein [Cytophagaceae bacterium]
MPTSIKKILENKNIKNVLSVNPETTVYEALEVMAQYNVGALLVMVQDELVGIFSERDYARKGIIKGRKAKTTPMTEVMTSNVFTVESKLTTRECMELMSQGRFRHLPVVENGQVIGVLSVGDIVNEMLQEQKQHISFLESYIAS